MPPEEKRSAGELNGPNGPDRDEAGAPSKLPAEFYEALPDNVKLLVRQAASYSGPLPPPSMYREYEEVLPGAADRILTMAEKDQDGRQKWEQQALDNADRGLWRGQCYGFIIALVSVSASVYLAAQGHGATLAVAVLLGGGGIAGLLGSFIKEIRKPSKNGPQN